MRFSWTGLLVAPLLVPIVSAMILCCLMGGDRPLLSFLAPLLPGCVVSYSATLFLFLPCMFLFSLWRQMTAFKVCLLGTLLGIVMFVPVTLLEWKSSGPDGPPIESFLSFFVRWTADPTTVLFPPAGLITAALYWWLETWRRDAALRA
jgi:hypothetical protein